MITYSRKVFIPLTRLCRDRCHYCTFATTPNRLPAAYLELEEVVAIAEAGAAQGCKEALFTLGDRPEQRWPQARQWLDERGYDDTLSYVRACAIAVLERTGLLPHLNPGVMTWAEISRLKAVAPSMGLMLETTADVKAHVGSPDKVPRVRLQVIEDAGRQSVPFTTGLLIGIGETVQDRAETLFALRKANAVHRHVQEVIVQNFRAKPDTAMRDHPDADVAEFLATIAVARLVLGPRMRIQAPPNLVTAAEVLALLDAGVDDLGGISPVTPDHVNPERPWPHLETLTAEMAARGWALRERLTAHPEFVRAGEPWIDPRIAAHVAALADADGLAADVRPVGLPWQEPDGGFASPGWTSSGRTDLHAAIDIEGRRQAIRSGGDWGDLEAVAATVLPAARLQPEHAFRRGMRPEFVQALSRAAEKLQAMDDSDALMLFDAHEGAELDALARLADDVRKAVVGETVSYVVNRNINVTNVCYTGCRFCAFAQRRTDADAYTLSLEQVADRAREAVLAGATEVCIQSGIHPDMPGTAYATIARTVREAEPSLHVHAFSPMEVMNAVARTGWTVEGVITDLIDAGVGSLPGTAAEILDDEVRWVLTRGKLPTAQWLDVVTTAHRLGLPTTSTMMYGHVDTPAHWLAHLRLIARTQGETGGFTEFVPLPFVHQGAPVYLAGIARPGPTVQENRAVHAMARLLLHGAIDNIQCSWVKLGDDGCLQVLAGGVNDLGGTLMEETISRMAGSEHGSARTVPELKALAAAAGRPVRERGTLYTEVTSRPRPLLPVVG